MTDVLFLSTTDPDCRQTGADVRTNALRDQLDEEFSVRTITFVDDPSATADDVVGIPASKYSAFRLIHPQYLRAVSREVSDGEYDVIFVANVFATLYGLLAMACSEAVTVFSDHNVTYQIEMEIGNYARAVVFYVAERVMCYSTDLVVTVSESDRQKLAEWSRGETIVIANGFDPDAYHPNGPSTDSDATEVLFFGTMWYEPNAEAARILTRQIAPAVDTVGADIRFRIIGPGASSLEIGEGHPAIDVDGFVEDLPTAIRRADLVVVPLVEGGGTRLKVIESLACGTPVLSTPKGAEGWPADWTNLQLSNLDSFPARIEEFADGGDFDTDEYDAILAYSWPRQGERLRERITSLVTE